MQQLEFIRGLNHLRHDQRASVVTIGAFDGVHRGHQRLLSQLGEASKAYGLPSVVIVFEPQPNEYFNRELAPARLMRLREKVCALSHFDVDSVLCLRFDQGTRGLTAQAFVEDVLVRGLGTKKMIVGDDFHFGADRTGDFSFLQKAGLEYGFDVSDTNTLMSADVRVSSTHIRSLLASNKLEEAAALLGRPYANVGRVVYGRQLGRTIGFPTMNVNLGRRKTPLSGVFAVDVNINGHSYSGVANIGVRPTVNQVRKAILEVHVLDANVDAYGQFIEVIYRKKIREETRFESVDELKAQIELDIRVARHFFD